MKSQHIPDVDERVLERLRVLARIHLVSIGQVYREYLVVATRSAKRIGLGLQSGEALHNVRQFATRIHLLRETRDVVAELQDLARRHSLTGTRNHDANLIAAMAVHIVPTLITANTAEFAVFAAIDRYAPEQAADELGAL